MNTKQLLAMINQGESETLEFKSTFNKAVIETIVAFSNAKGGKILLGVNDQSEITGLEINKESIQKWLNEIKQNTVPSVIPITETIDIESKTLVLFTVPEYPVKPVSYREKYFIRKQNSNHKLSVDEISELRFSSLHYSFDAYETQTKMSELDNDALTYFKNLLANSGRFKLSGDITVDFQKLGIIKNHKLTRAADLLFGLHHCNIHIGRFKSETTIIDDIMIRQPIILSVDMAMDFIKKNIRYGFEVGGSTTKRKEKWQYPLPVIRELLLNAIVHRDYSNPTDLIIKIYDDSLEITNPGGLLGGLTVGDLQTGNYVSKHRNKIITEAFYLTGDIEKYGTGYRRIYEYLALEPNTTIILNDLNGFFQAKLKRITDTVYDTVNDTVNDTLNIRHKQIISLIKENKEITVNQLADKCKVARSTIVRDMNKLKHLNRISRIGSDKSGHWEATE